VLSRRFFLAGAAALVVTRANAASPLRQFSKSAASTTIPVDHSAWDRLVKTYVKPDATGLNRVAYARWKASGRAALDEYLTMLQGVPVSALSRADQYAFWVNLYNAKTIAVVLERYPVRSIRDIDLGGSFFGNGPWSARLLRVEGTDLTLDDIEHRILRPLWRDPRTHYAVNCASVGCPNLVRQAFTSGNTASLLETGARAFVDHPRGVVVSDGAITASKIYDWFAEDFGDETALRAHWSRYAGPAKRQEIEAATSIAGYDYDWSLNDAG